MKSVGDLSFRPFFHSLITKEIGSAFSHAIDFKNFMKASQNSQKHTSAGVMLNKVASWVLRNFSTVVRGTWINHRIWVKYLTDFGRKLRHHYWCRSFLAKSVKYFIRRSCLTIIWKISLREFCHSSWSLQDFLIIQRRQWRRSGFFLVNFEHI